jgi:antitoxin (DNA-binding transcriptional repressor) of toxin-antitoxin stability system
MSQPQRPESTNQPSRPHRLRLRQVGIRTFRDHASQLLASGEVLEIERHGKTIGYFIPVSSGDAAAARRALTELNEAVAAVLATGLIDEDGLSQALDLSEPR